MVKSNAEEGLWLEDVPEPVPVPNDSLIRVKRALICGTDIHLYKRDAGTRKALQLAAPGDALRAHLYRSVSRFRAGMPTAGFDRCQISMAHTPQEMNRVVHAFVQAREQTS